VANLSHILSREGVTSILGQNGSRQKGMESPPKNFSLRDALQIISLQFIAVIVILVTYAYYYEAMT